MFTASEIPPSTDLFRDVSDSIELALFPEHHLVDLWHEGDAPFLDPAHIYSIVYLWTPAHIHSKVIYFS